MRIESLLPASDQLVVESLRIEPSFVEIGLRRRGLSAVCPHCSVSSRHVHSRYRRTVHDLPWRGTPVLLRFTVRRFFCGNADCRQRIFVEQVPGLAARRARRTPRLNETLVKIGLECGGEPGARLSRQLGIPTSGDTLLRRLRAIPPTKVHHATCIGIDDFAFRRGQRYGTIVVDHGTGRPIDLLPDREGETVRQWLKDRPAPAIVTRDRSAGYAAAITAGAPDAVQIADRWHLLVNAREALVRVLDRHHRVITDLATRIRDENSAAMREPDSATVPTETSLPPCRQREADLSASRRARRLSRYEQVLDLHRQGYSQRSITKKLKISRRTLIRFIRSGAFPERAKVSRHHVIDPFVARLKQLWAEGHRDAKQLCTIIRLHGFTGSHYAVRRCVAPWRTARERLRLSGPRTTARPTARLIRPSSNRLAWLLVRPELPREPDEARLESLLLEECEPIASSARLISRFGTVIKERKLSDLTMWVNDATRAEIATDVKVFANGIVRDWPEVSAAVRSHYSNGRTEGHVNRLKMIKRKMYGRAKFDLLRIRVLASGP